MPYIFDNYDTYIKKCETEACPNKVSIGVSRTHCIVCLNLKAEEIILKPIPYFEQTKVM